MTYYEGILVANGSSINAAAIGAEIDEGSIGSQVYKPSDTARKLKDGSRFTFSLTDKPELFYKVALAGHDRPQRSELSKDDLVKDGGFFYPKDATRIYFCEVKRTRTIKEKDEYGDTEIKLVEGEVLEKRGDGDHIGREEPLVDAMVYATRMYVADEEQKKSIKEKVEDVLAENDSNLKKKILDFVEGKIDEI